jgi:WD40 repeat protein
MLEWFAISSSSDEATFVWSVGTLTVHHNVKANGALPGSGSCVVGGNWLIASQGSRPAVHLYSLGSSESPLKCPMPERMRVVASPCGSFLFGGGASGKLYAWALGSGALVAVVEAHYRDVTCLAITSDGACLVSGGEDGVVHAWMVSALVDSASSRRPQALHTWTAHGLKITGLHCGVGACGETVVLSSSLDCTVKVWRLGSGALVADVLFPRAITSVVMDALEQYVFAGASDGSVFCANFKESAIEKHMAVAGDEGDGDATKQFRSVLSAHTLEVSVLKVASVGVRQVLLSGSRDGLVNVWDVESGELMSTFKKHNSVAVTAIDLVLLPSGCEFPERQQVAVAKLQKFQQDNCEINAGLLWRCIAPAVTAVEARQHSSSGAAEVVERTDGEGLQERVQQLERENEELRGANKRLYEFNVDKVLEKKQRKLKRKKVKAAQRNVERNE